MNKQFIRRFSLLLSLLLMLTAFPAVSLAESAPAQDPSPAIYVYQKTASSVVGVITQEQTWIPEYNRIHESTVSMGSGVVLREGGYILTNSHVIESGSTFQILMPSGEKAPAELVGADSSTDIAVLKITDEAAIAQLTPVETGASSDLLVGSTVIAIGNPGGETLANTVTQGVVSALERNSVSASRTSREISYIQHDAAINSGNSGGGLFDYRGRLVGINTLKYSGSVYSSVSFEGLGFAIPIETALDISADLIEYGKVRRASMGINVSEYLNGPEEPMRSVAPSGVYVTGVIEDTPAASADFKAYDYIYSIDGERILSYSQMATFMDRYEEGDTITVELVRYEQITPATSSINSLYDSFFSANTQASTTLVVSGGYETVTTEVTLAYLDN